MLLLTTLLWHFKVVDVIPRNNDAESSQSETERRIVDQRHQVSDVSEDKQISNVL